MEIHEFLPRLYGGGRLDLDPRCWSFIRSHIDVVVNLRTIPDSPPFDFTGRRLLWMPIRDKRAPDLSWTRDMILLLDHWLDAGHSIYVHDTRGINRLGFMVTAMLMKRCGLPLNRALDQARRIKSNLLPKPWYMELLRQLETHLQKELPRIRIDGVFRVKADVDLPPDTIRRLVREHYGLTVRFLEKVRGVYRVETDRGDYGFKKADELPDLPLIAGCLRHIKENGFQWIPEPVTAVDGKLMVDHEGEPYFMEEWLDLKEIPPHSLPYFKKMGVALAEFHHASAGLAPPETVPDRNRWGKHPALLSKASKRLETWQRQFRNSSSDVSVQLAFLSTRCQLAQQTLQEVSHNTLLQNHPESAVWCHNALQHRNIMLDQREQIWFIDFETLAYAERVRDLAHLLEHHAAPYGWPPSAVRQFLSAYESGAAAPLSREEWLLLRAHLTFPERLYKRVRRCYGRPHARSKDWRKLHKLLQREQMKESLLHHLTLLTPGGSPEG